MTPHYLGDLPPNFLLSTHQSMVLIVIYSLPNDLNLVRARTAIGQFVEFRLEADSEGTWNEVPRMSTK